MKNKIIGPSHEQLKREWDFLKRQKVDGIPGILIFDSGVPGPCVGITAMTHGNEPSGVACAWHYRRAGNLAKRLVRGKVIIVLNNIEASKAYFAAKKIGDKVKVKSSRYIDRNLNRLPDNFLRIRKSDESEIIRAKELLPIWHRFDVAMDIHSTLTKSAPMIITVGGFHPELFKGFPIDIIVSNIDEVQIGKPATWFYGRGKGKTPVMGIEAGSHGNKKSLLMAIRSVEALLANVMVIDQPARTSRERIYTEYRIDKSLVAEADGSRRLVRRFKMFGLVRGGSKLADGTGGTIKMPYTGHILMAPKGRIIEDGDEETLFISLPKKTIKI